MFPFVALLALLGITMVTDTSTDSDESDDQPSDGAQPADPVQGDLLRVMMQDSMAAEDTAADPIISDDDTAEEEASDTLDIVRVDYLDLLQSEMTSNDPTMTEMELAQAAYEMVPAAEEGSAEAEFQGVLLDIITDGRFELSDPYFLDALSAVIDETNPDATWENNPYFDLQEEIITRESDNLTEEAFPAEIYDDDYDPDLLYIDDEDQSDSEVRDDADEDDGIVRVDYLDLLQYELSGSSSGLSDTELAIAVLEMAPVGEDGSVDAEFRNILEEMVATDSVDLSDKSFRQALWNVTKQINSDTVLDDNPYFSLREVIYFDSIRF